MAPNAIDYSGYPDCRPEYFHKMTEALAYGSKLWTEYQIPIQVKTPIIELSKMEIVKLGLRLKAPLELTWSCYQGGAVPCGSCDSCLLRAKGFEEAGVSDPALTRSQDGL
jgi:7-cyano-7-deazaguanine synthase